MRNLYVTLFFGVAFGANAQIINFTDANFKARLLQSTNFTVLALDSSGNPMAIDANGNNEIEVSEAANVWEVDLRQSQISNFVGLENFINLRKLQVQGNYVSWLDVTMLSHLKELDCSSCFLSGLNIFNLPSLERVTCRYNSLTNMWLAGLPSLKVFDCTDNDIATLDLSGLPNLEELYCDQNNLTQLDVSGLTNLKQLYCGQNSLTNIDVSGGMPNLIALVFYMNQVTSIDLSGMPNLETLNCYQNQIAQFDFSNNAKLKDLVCSWNAMTTLDVSACHQLQKITCNASPNLVYINMKNGSFNWDANFQDCPNLQYVCADEDLNDLIYESSWMQNLINVYQYANCHLNSYCSFTPGGVFYAIDGHSKFDYDNNGCDSADIPVPTSFAVSSDTTSWTYVADASGHHSIAVPAGSYTVTPTYENPSYFSFSPNVVTVDFPTAASPTLQDFCLTPIGVHQDLQVVILPLVPARPGFDAKYKLLLRNKGNVAVSGSVSFAFEDARIDLVSATPAVATQAFGNLTWNYTDLLPLETSEIIVVMNINSPMETPPVVIGQQLNFQATIDPVAGDEKPEDNTIGLKQTVVGSLDPNDKTCLEGNVVGPEMIGQYVNYLIRFENTGTYPAENIVVKDVIDTTKFDIASIVPLAASHPHITRIISGNKVEFIFENINLPFDDANNDGFVAFKIKTKPTLVLGDTFSNSASIYFDYNFPIVTSTATTSIQQLSTPVFEFSNEFILYPNPAKNVLSIKSKNGMEVKSVSVYNMLGQLILVTTGNTETIDISRLIAGSYIVKVYSDKGMATSKVLKL